MATTKSNLITNEEATPAVSNIVSKQGGRIRTACDSFEVLAADVEADGDIMRLCRRPAHAVGLGIKIWSDDLGSSGTVDCGVYATDSDTDTNAAIFANNFDISGQVTNGTDLRTQAATAAALASIGKRLYECLATPLTTDPQVFYDIALTVEAVCSNPGTVSFAVEYTID